MSNAIGVDPVFLRTGIIDVDAAVVGVGTNSWIGIPDEAHSEDARRIMQDRKFDILPVDGKGEVEDYFITEQWNDFTAITRKTITHRDIIPARTSVRDVIKGFAEVPRDFYFLSTDGRVSGLITIVNLNCRQVKVYLFGLISELETRLGDFIADRVDEKDLYELMLGNPAKEKFREPCLSYEVNKKNGVEARVVEYLYLIDLIKVVTKKHLCGELRYDKKEFTSRFDTFNVLRNDVAHPNRSIVTDASCVTRLWETIDGIEEALFRLQHSSPH